jgi:hypothetical protein
MAFAGTRRTEKQRVFVLGDEVGGGEIEDEAAVHLLIEVEVEVIERFERIAKLRVFSAAFQQTIAPTIQFVGYETRDQIKRRHALALRLMQTGFQHSGHATKAKLS